MSHPLSPEPNPQYNGSANQPPQSVGSANQQPPMGQYTAQGTFQPGYAPQPPKKKRGPLMYILGGCGCLVLVGSLIGGCAVVAGVAGSGDSDSGTSSSAPVSSKGDKKADKKEDNVPAEYKSALRSAETYSDMMHMSKKGIYDQLTSEADKFSPEAADYAMKHLKADYKKNALESAKTYQEGMAMSPEAIREQLTSEYGGKFTKEEADYAIDHLND